MSNPGDDPREESGRGIQERNRREESGDEFRRGIQKGIQKRNPEEDSMSRILERSPRESRRGIWKTNPGAESRIRIQRGIRERNPEWESREEPRRGIQRGIQERNPVKGAREESRRGIQGRNPESQGPGQRRGPGRGERPSRTRKIEKSIVFYRIFGASDLQTRVPFIFFGKNERHCSHSNFFRGRGQRRRATFYPLTFVRQNPYSQSLFGEK